MLDRPNLPSAGARIGASTANNDLSPQTRHEYANPDLAPRVRGSAPARPIAAWPGVTAGRVVTAPQALAQGYARNDDGAQRCGLGGRARSLRGRRPARAARAGRRRARVNRKRGGVDGRRWPSRASISKRTRGSPQRRIWRWGYAFASTGRLDQAEREALRSGTVAGNRASRSLPLKPTAAAVNLCKNPAQPSSLYREASQLVSPAVTSARRSTSAQHRQGAHAELYRQAQCDISDGGDRPREGLGLSSPVNHPGDPRPRPPKSRPKSGILALACRPPAIALCQRRTRSPSSIRVRGNDDLSAHHRITEITGGVSANHSPGDSSNESPTSDSPC